MALRDCLRTDSRQNAGRSCLTCQLSVGGLLDSSGLGKYWSRRDDIEGATVTKLVQRDYLFSELSKVEHRAVRVDIGCGTESRPGFIGIDRFPLPGVSVVCDLEKGIPLADGSVDYLLASHS